MPVQSKEWQSGVGAPIGFPIVPLFEEGDEGGGTAVLTAEEDMDGVRRSLKQERRLEVATVEKVKKEKKRGKEERGREGVRKRKQSAQQRSENKS
jgi:hypothetical protein